MDDDEETNPMDQFYAILLAVVIYIFITAVL